MQGLGRHVFHKFLSKVMSSVSWSCVISRLTTSPWYFFCLPLLLLKPSTASQPFTHSPPHLDIRTSVHLLFTWSNYLTLAFYILSSIEATTTLFQISSFLILCFLLCPCIHRNILISTTFIFWIWEFFIGQYSTPCNILGVTTTL